MLGPLLPWIIAPPRMMIELFSWTRTPLAPLPLIVLQDARCNELMWRFIREQPALWN